ncbi:capsular exopolysaccharide family [Thiothrix nivea DSM 5205]|uniref:Capsular exopolysaccharide family n=2 Tax=Thiothrix nivea TaxID=1031 RepID=A0A656HJY1_THINJ|nr:capsular exopolysaccharide family [Thiothrix nivea DSM 5205]
MKQGGEILIPVTESPYPFRQGNEVPIILNAESITSRASERDLTLSHIWEIIKKRKWLILSTLCCGLLATFLLTKLTPPSYQANATIRIEKEPTRIVEFGQIFDTEQKDSVDVLQTEYELLKSRALAERVVKEMGLTETLLNANQPWFSKLFGNGDAPVVDTSSKLHKAAETFSKKLFIQPLEQSRLVKIYFEAPQATQAADITNTLISTYIKMRNEAHTETGDYAKGYLEQQIDTARRDLTQSEQRLIDYAKKKNILNIDDSQTVNVQKLTDMNQALADAERRRIQTESKYKQLQATGGNRDALDNLAIQNMKNTLATLEAEYQEKSRLFKPGYPDMQRLSSQIADMRRTIGKETASVTNAIKAEYLAAKEEENKLHDRLSKLNNELMQIQDKSIEYNALKREVETNRQLYDELLQRMREVNVASGVNPSIVRIIDEAQTPLQRYRPNMPLNLLIGLLGGLLGGIALAFLREGMDDSVHTDEDMEKFTGLPVLGSIPELSKLPETTLALKTLKEPRSELAEAYRILVANLGTALKKEKGNSILFTSIEPGEGKSTTAINVAYAYARMRYKVLLVDADMRCPTLHHKLGIDNNVGLGDYLDNSIDLPNIHSIDADANLHILTAGSETYDPVGLLSSNHMLALMGIAARRYNYIIIDAPPLKGFADPLVLSAMSSATVLLVGPNNSNQRMINAAIKQLKRAGGNLTGFLRMKVKRSHTVGQHYYDRYYQQRSHQLVPIASEA